MLATCIATGNSNLPIDAFLTGGYIHGMTVEDTRLKNLKALIREAGTVSALAQAAGTSPSYISQITTGTTSRTGKVRSVGADLARKLESACDKPVGWMDRDHDENVTAGPELRGKIPLISWVQAGNFAEATDLLHVGDAIEWVESSVQPHENTFALRVAGDSMEPDFPAGTVLIVEPDLEAHPGDYVIAKNGDQEATFKQLVKDGADWYLKPLNPRYPIKALTGCRIVGVVRAAERRFR